MIDLRNSPYFRISSETWAFFKTSLPVQSNDYYWDKVLTDAETIINKYAGTPQAEFAKDQVFSVVNELDRIRKAGDFASLSKPDPAARKPLQRAEN